MWYTRAWTVDAHPTKNTHSSTRQQHVVFGFVEEGLDVLKRIESVGSQTGKTSQPVVIADCGQL